MDTIRLPRAAFPSPLGEMGLSISIASPFERILKHSFRPLSGKWGYRFALATDPKEKRHGFRPLSGKWGYRFIDNGHEHKYAGGFPSPLGEMGLSIPERNTTMTTFTWFPSPLGEMGLSIRVVARALYATTRSFRPLSGKWGYRLALSVKC